MTPAVKFSHPLIDAWLPVKLPNGSPVNAFTWKGAKIQWSVWLRILNFMRWSFETHKSESMVVLYYHKTRKEWQAIAFPQEGRGLHVEHLKTDVALTKAEKLRAALGPGWLEFGSVHNHCSIGSFQSGTDAGDEGNKDGIHITVGKLDQTQIDSHARLLIKGCNLETNIIDWVARPDGPPILSDASDAMWKLLIHERSLYAATDDAIKDWTEHYSCGISTQAYDDFQAIEDWSERYAYAYPNHEPGGVRHRSHLLPEQMYFKGISSLHDNIEKHGPEIAKTVESWIEANAKGMTTQEAIARADMGMYHELADAIGIACREHGAYPYQFYQYYKQQNQKTDAVQNKKTDAVLAKPRTSSSSPLDPFDASLSAIQQVDSACSFLSKTDTDVANALIAYSTYIERQDNGVNNALRYVKYMTGENRPSRRSIMRLCLERMVGYDSETVVRMETEDKLENTIENLEFDLGKFAAAILPILYNYCPLDLRAIFDTTFKGKDVPDEVKTAALEYWNKMTEYAKIASSVYAHPSLPRLQLPVPSRVRTKA